jgi:electron transfer flavoprotein alpha subunit
MSENSQATTTAPLWTVPGPDTVAIVDEARRVAERLASETGDTRPRVVVIAFDGMFDTEELPGDSADEVLVVAREDEDSFQAGSAGVHARAAALRSLAAEDSPRAVVLPSTPDGDELAASTSRRLRGGCVTDCLLRVRDGDVTAGRAVYGERAYAELSFEGGPPVVSLNTEALGTSETTATETPSEERREVRVEDDDSVRQVSVLDVPEQDLSRAQRIVAGGYGLGGPDGFELIDDLADALGAATGASRPPADEEWVPYDRQIGVTGKEIDVDLYVPCAISGDSYHMRTVSADHLVPINSDPDARIFNFADIGIVGDVYEHGPVLADAIRAAMADAAEDNNGENRGEEAAGDAEDAENAGDGEEVPQ